MTSSAKRSITVSSLLGLVFFGVQSCAQGAVVVGPECATGEATCDKVCSDLKTDSENCGKCGVVCPGGQACVAGACTTSCPSGNALCGGDGGKAACVNTKSDNTNCGKCNAKCPSGQVCYAGGCSNTCGGTSSGQTLCTPDGGAPYCANLKNDNANCGKCGAPCASGDACIGGACASACTLDQTLCGTDGGTPYCANLQTDNANCGDCEKKCGAFESCDQGTCQPQCAFYQKLCTPDGGQAYCASTSTDNTNCGTCGKVCPPNAPVCVAGQCKTGGQPPTCVQANGLTWCYNANACGQACTAVCAAIGMSVYPNLNTWFAAQNTSQLCANISQAFGLGAGVSVTSYTYACLEDAAGNHTAPGGLIGPLLCSSYSSCPQNHLATMDQIGTPCGANSRRSICPCQ